MSSQLMFSYVSPELPAFYQSIVRNYVGGVFDPFFVVLLTGISYFGSRMKCRGEVSHLLIILSPA